MCNSSIITDRIGRHEVLLPINHNYNKIYDILSSSNKIKTRDIPIQYQFKCPPTMELTVQLLGHDAYCSITLFY